MEQEINQHQIFDNAFLSGCAWHKRLLIPLVNEIFNKSIPEDAFIEHESNEKFTQSVTNSGKETLIKRITDALIRVDNGKYHFECESKKDGGILIRIGEYDMQIAVNDAEYENYSVKMELPETAVIFLRNHRGLPETGTITYHKGNQTLTHSIPFVLVNDYSLEYIADKHLYLLCPFYLMRYEYAIKNTPNKYEMIENEAYKVYDCLVKAYENTCISSIEYENLLILCKDVVSELSKSTDINERLINIMGNEVLLTAEERGIVKGIEQGVKQGIEKGAFDSTLNLIKNAMESFNISFDEVCDKLKIKDREKYKSFIK